MITYTFNTYLHLNFNPWSLAMTTHVTNLKHLWAAETAKTLVGPRSAKVNQSVGYPHNCLVLTVGTKSNLPSFMVVLEYFINHASNQLSN